MIRKFPKLLTQHPIICKLASYIERSNVCFSSILHKKDNKLYLINKNEHTPYFQLDWRCYSMMRVWVNTILTTGAILRQQKITYLGNGSFGDQFVDEMYNSIRINQRQNVIVLSREMSFKQMQAFINPQFYNSFNLNTLLQGKAFNANVLMEILQKRQLFPVLVECGTSILNQHFLQKGEHPLIDLIMLCEYEGQLENRCIGNQFDISLNGYRLLWESQSEPILIDGKEGKMKFYVYGSANSKFLDL